jgi:hypothetical protein
MVTLNLYRFPHRILLTFSALLLLSFSLGNTMSVEPPDSVQDLQTRVLHELNLLQAPRLGILEMEVDLQHPSMPLPPEYSKQDICSLIHQNRVSKTLIYFPPKYTHDKKGRSELYADLGKAALLGGDRISLWGKGNSKNQVMYLRCQCSIIYRGTKVDHSDGAIIPRSDYRNGTYSNDRKNNRHGQKGRSASRRTDVVRSTTPDEGRCSFSLPVFLDETGYYLNIKKGNVMHEFHSRRDHLRAPLSHLVLDEVQLIEDLNTARAKLGTAANLHYVRSGREGTPTLLSRSQVAYILSKKEA